ncbi:MAG: hypothetical protein AABY45_06705 [Deltaproteobacteria bacterium]
MRDSSASPQNDKRNMNDLTIKENLIDRVIRFIDPVKAERRFRARAALALSSSYIGASRAKRSLRQWKTSWGERHAL